MFKPADITNSSSFPIPKITEIKVLNDILAQTVFEDNLLDLNYDQNFFIVCSTVPVACTVTVSPLATMGPEPAARVSLVVAYPGMGSMSAWARGKRTARISNVRTRAFICDRVRAAIFS